jgi:uncharacterized protein (TIGR03382 family)
LAFYDLSAVPAAGLMCLGAAILVLLIGRRDREELKAAAAE